MEFDIRKDLSIIKAKLGISNNDLAEALNISISSFSKLINGKEIPSLETLERVYSFASNNNIDLNKVKLTYLEPFKPLYFHGSKDGITGLLSLDKSSIRNDFGKGFYLGDNYEQSLDFIANSPEGSIYVFNAKLNNLNIVSYEVDSTWMLTILLNRGMLEKYSDTKLYKQLKSKIDSADVIIAPIADNRMYTIMRLFSENLMPLSKAYNLLAKLNVGNQYVFKTQKSLDALKEIDHLFVSKIEKQQSYSRKIVEEQESIKRLEEDKTKFDPNDKYIEELFKQWKR